MNRKIKFYEISNEDEDNIEKTTKRLPNIYDKRLKVKGINLHISRLKNCQWI